MIELREVSKSFGNCVIFKEIDLKIEHAGIYVILGESGSGKSTLLNMLAGYEPVSSGEIIKKGIMATIFQNYELIPELTIRDNIYLAHKIKHTVINNEKRIFDLLGLNELMDHYPNELSVGQKQRVGIARALFQEPSIILCDEPTESLDQENKQVVMQLLHELSKDHIILMASHDRKIIEQYADVIYKINNQKIETEVIHELKTYPKILNEQPTDKKQVSFFLKKILWKKSVIFSLVISLLTAGALTLYGIEKKLFQPFQTFESVTKDVVYVQSKIPNYDFSELKLSAKQLLEFNSLSYEHETYRFLTVPYIENELLIDGKKPEGLEVLVNQNAAKRLGEECIGKTVTLKYQFDWRYDEIEMVITGIIYENDIEREVVYYNEAALNQTLNQKLDEKGISQYEKLQDNASYFMIQSEYEKIDKIYTLLQQSSEFVFESPLYDERVKENQQKQVYQITFQIVEILLLIGIIVMMVIYSYLDTQKYMRNCSIFIILGASVSLVKKIYLQVKLSIFTILYFITILVQHVLFINLTNYSFVQADYLILMLGITIIYLIYLLIIYSSLRLLKIDRINTLLKYHQDS